MRNGLKYPRPGTRGTNFFVSVSDGNGRDYFVHFPNGLGTAQWRDDPMTKEMAKEIEDTLASTLLWWRAHRAKIPQLPADIIKLKTEKPDER